MKKVVFIIFIFFLFHNLQAQEIMGRSQPISVNITKDPPILLLVEGSETFSDANGNKRIDADENCYIEFWVENKGKGAGTNLILKTQVSGNTRGISFQNSLNMGSIEPGAKKKISLPLKGTMDLTTGTAIFKLKLDEAMGFGLDEIQMEVNTRAFINPFVKIADYSVTSENSSTLVKKRPFDLQVLVQNVEQGIAEDVNVKLVLPQNVICISGNEVQTFKNLNPGETQNITYSLIVNELYTSTSIPIQINISEKYGKYSENKNITLQLNQAMAAAKLVVKSNATDEKVNIKEASLKSDVDKNIPETGYSNPNAYALIIGNEDYTSYQTGITSEANVDFAVNDALVFSEYCKKTLGVPEKQIKYIPNGTAAQMKSGLAWLTNLAKIDEGKATLYFYYSGHGLPDEKTKEAYIIPVDVTGKDVTSGLKLDDVYNQLTSHPVKKVIVFIDACFSGGARNQSLIAYNTKAVKMKPKDNTLSGNIVVFTSSTGEESSEVYKEKQHGYLTYFLLKKLQETKGDVSCKDLADYIKEKVTKEAALKGKIQNPNVLYSPAVDKIWEKWSVR